MLPVYYTTTNTRKRKKSKKTQSQIAAEKEHEKFLKKMGIGSRSSVGSEQRSSKPWVTGSSPVESAKSQTRSSVWSERTAHNGYVTGSNPLAPTSAFMTRLLQRKRNRSILVMRLLVLHRCINLMRCQFVIKKQQKMLLR